MKLLEEIPNLHPDEHIALLLRHGNRDKIPEGEFGDDIELNETGFLRSFEYGNKIKHLTINKIFTSPVKRCMQTADKIREGTGRDIPVITTNLLGDPGPFVEDARLAGENFMKLGNHATYFGLLEGRAIPGFSSLETGADRLNAFLQSEMDQPGLNLFISHDMIIALYAFAAYRKKYTFENWVKYLEGPIIRLKP